MSSLNDVNSRQRGVRPSSVLTVEESKLYTVLIYSVETIPDEFKGVGQILSLSEAYCLFYKKI